MAVRPTCAPGCSSRAPPGRAVWRSGPTGILSGALFSGMYPNDQAVLENGNRALVEPDASTSPLHADWKGGWSAVKRCHRPRQRWQSPLVQRYPPDILITVMGRGEHFRGGGTGETIAGRASCRCGSLQEPGLRAACRALWPTACLSLLLPESRLTAKRLSDAPNGPEQDGIHIELPARSRTRLGR